MNWALRLFIIFVIIIAFLIFCFMIMTFLSRWMEKMPTNNMKDFGFVLKHDQNNVVSVEFKTSFYKNDDNITE